MSNGSLLRSAGQVAAGTLMSRITGFVRTLALAALLGTTLVNDAYNVANTLPNQVFELLLGGVLTSVIVPLLVRAEKDAELRGQDRNEYPQRLFSIAVAGLTVATVIGVAGSGLLVSLMNIRPGMPHFETATLMAMLLLPQMIFYGIGALAGAVLNTRESYRAPAWAPVVNNLVVIAIAVGMIVLREGAEGFSTTEVVVLSLGTTLGIVIQALILIPAWRKAGFHWKWRFDIRGMGLGELRGLALWLVAYVLIGQVGFIVATNVANVASSHEPGQLSQWVYAALLFQLPYGILGVSLLTALMPKMSRAARDGDWPKVKDYLADGTRLTGLGMIPVSVAFWVLAVPLTVLFFDNLRFDGDAARSTGLILAAASFGLLPYAVTLLQLRVFFAAKDAKTPSLVMVGIVAVRVALSLLCLLLPAHQIVLGLAVANSVAFLVGAIAGDVVLRRQFGRLGTGRVLRDLLRQAVAAVGALVVMTPVYLLLQSLFADGPVWSWGGLTGVPLLQLNKLEIGIVLALSSAVGLVAFVGFAIVLGVPELRRLLRRVPGRVPPGKHAAEYRGRGTSGELATAVDAESADGYTAGVAARPDAPPSFLDAPVPIPPGGLPTDGRQVHADEPDETISTDDFDTDPGRTVAAEPASDAGDGPDRNDSAEDDVAGKRKYNKWTLLGLTCAGLVIALVLGWFTGILAGKVFGPEEQPRASSTDTSSAPATATGSGETPGEALQITQATLFDPPPGDGEENPDQIDLSYDGQPGTTWPTLQYQGTAAFGNIKPGVGIIYDLGSEKTLSQVKIQTTIPGASVEIRTAAAQGDSLEQYATVAGATLESSTDIPIPEGTAAQYVLVWITGLVKQPGGYFQASLSEVSLIS